MVAPPTTRDGVFVPRVGDRIRLRIHDEVRTFEVTECTDPHRDLLFRVRVAEFAGRNRRWDLRALPVGSIVYWGPVAITVCGRTAKAMRLQIFAFLEDPSVPNEQLDAPGEVPS